MTRDAVFAVQSIFGLNIDGSVGPNTWDRLMREAANVNTSTLTNPGGLARGVVNIQQFGEFVFLPENGETLGEQLPDEPTELDSQTSNNEDWPGQHSGATEHFPYGDESWDGQMPDNFDGDDAWHDQPSSNFEAVETWQGQQSSNFGGSEIWQGQPASGLGFPQQSVDDWQYQHHGGAGFGNSQDFASQQASDSDFLWFCIFLLAMRSMSKPQCRCSKGQ